MWLGVWFVSLLIDQESKTIFQVVREGICLDDQRSSKTGGWRVVMMMMLCSVCMGRLARAII